MEARFHRQFQVRLLLPERTLEGVIEVGEARGARFEPVAEWARAWASCLNTAVPWQIGRNGTVVCEDVALPEADSAARS